MTNTLAIILASLALFFLCTGPAQARQTLHGHVPGAITDLKLLAVGRPPATATLRLAISLPTRNREALTNFLQELYTPGNPNFRKFLTPAQFTEKFGPTEQDYQALIEFARSNGLTVTATFSNRMILDVVATVADIERVFHVTMRLYQHPTEDRQFYAPDSEPSLDCSVPVLYINGLDNYIVPHPVSGKPVVASGEGKGGAQGGSGPGGSFYAQDIRTAYLPGVTTGPAGQSVGLLEYSGYYVDLITDYMVENGILPFNASAVVENWEVDGASGNPATNAPYTNSYYECELDIEMAMAFGCPDSIIVYELPAITPAGYNGIIQGVPPDDALNLMALQDLCNQISSSWEFAVKPSTDAIFQEMGAQGQSFFQASGDGGGRTGTNVYSPFDDAFVTLVGATSLTTKTNGDWRSEVVWNEPFYAIASGGGISPNYPIPTWQQGVNMSSNGGSNNWRNMPDVAIVGSNVFAVYGEPSGPNQPATQGGFSGTSVSAPLWASFMAIVNSAASEKYLPPVGFINPIIYKIGTNGIPAYPYLSCFHDITNGNNYLFYLPVRFNAVPGYDLCTGWGSPNGSNLINALVLNEEPFPRIKMRQMVFNTPNLLGFWSFDPAFLANSCVNGYTGTPQGNAYIGPPGSGVPLPLSPTNQTLVLDGNSSWLLTDLVGQIADQGTIMAWIYLTAQPSSLGHDFAITEQSQAGNNFGLQIQTDDHLYFYTDTGTSTVYPEALPLNQWHWVAATFVANSNRSIYLDGALVAASNPGGHTVSTNPFSIGASAVFAGRYFAGKISDAAVFNRALSAGEIAALYSASLPTPDVTQQPGQVLLSWPTNYADFALQVNANLATTNWMDWPGTPPIVNGQYTVTNVTPIPNGPKHLFFRLVPQ